MKYKFYCGVEENNCIINKLQKLGVKYNTCSLTNMVFFTVYSDDKEIDDLLKYIDSLPDSTIHKSSVFSKDEMDKAEWYLWFVARMGIDTSNVKFTYNAKCLFYTSSYGMQKYYHLDQVDSFVSKKTPGWKNGYNFCSVGTGFKTKIFCSNEAKERIKANEIKGLDFMKVLKGDLKTETPDVSQLVFKNKLRREAFDFIGAYKEQVCPLCGRVNYVFDEPSCDNIRLNTALIPEGIDAFGSLMNIGEGFGDELVVISKKFYNLIINELKEKPKHFVFFPIG